MSTAVLHTIGYEKRTIEEFLALLRASRIDVLVDVREIAWSHKPGFSKRPLEEMLRAAGLEYVHAAFAGNPKRIRASGGTGEEILARYRRHLEETPEILDRLEELVAEWTSRGKRVALACFERDPRDCHRGVLAFLWSARTGGRVVHLDPATPSPEHAGSSR